MLLPGAETTCYEDDLLICDCLSASLGHEWCDDSGFHWVEFLSLAKSPLGGLRDKLLCPEVDGWVSHLPGQLIPTLSRDENQPTSLSS